MINVPTEDRILMPSPNHIVFFDTTLRDGEQSPGCTMHHEEKLRLAHQIADLGVDVLEAGFAIASDGDFAAIRAVAHEVRGPRIASLSRAKREDIEASARAVEPAASNRIHLVIASSTSISSTSSASPATRPSTRPPSRSASPAPSAKT
jgi:2-isopropylmalate synthase